MKKTVVGCVFSAILVLSMAFVSPAIAQESKVTREIKRATEEANNDLSIHELCYYLVCRLWFRPVLIVFFGMLCLVNKTRRVEFSIDPCREVQYLRGKYKERLDDWLEQQKHDNNTIPDNLPSPLYEYQ